MIACLVLIIPIMQNAPVSKEAVVQVKNKEVLRFSLLENANYAVDGTLGKVSIEVKDGAVRLKQENSPHLYFSKQGFVDSVNTPIVCLPNETVVRIEGQEDGEDVQIQ